MILPGMVTPAELTLRFHDRGHPGSHRVAATALAQALEALQRLVHITAMRREGRTPGRRIRPSGDIQARYRLVCDLPSEGSYITPIGLDGADLLSPAESVGVLSEVATLLEAVGKQDEQAILKAIPDDTWRRFSLDAIERMAPSPSTETGLEVLRNGERIIDTDTVRAFVERLARGTKSSIREAVIGEFKRIDFDARQITIRHSATGRNLTCIYEAHVEESLLDHPRDTLLVFGTVSRDEAGGPISIADVDHIEPVDEDPIAVTHVEVAGNHLEPSEPINAEVKFDEADALYTAIIPSLMIRTFAETREELIDAVESELALLWKRYATAHDSSLTPAAQTLKKRMQAAFHSRD